MVCAVEGIMPQTETVLKQALQEKVKPILFINKVDRAIKELKLTPEQLQQRLGKLVVEVNKFIQRNVDPAFKDKWIARVEDGSVAFGSALKKWAISIPYMKKTGVTFKQVIDLCARDQDEELAKIAPMHIVVMESVINHLPSPTEAQVYRIPRIWKGDPESEIGKQLLACDPNGKLAACITKIVYDPHAGMISTARVFSGRIVKGQDVYLVGSGKTYKLQQVTTFIADKRISIDQVLAGNVVGMSGLVDATAGETLCDPNFVIDKFEAITHIFEPVVTKSMEPKNPQDLPKLIEILKILGKEDPTLKIKINPETGETLISGLGELHLDAKVERKIREKGVDIVVSPPIVVYRETVGSLSPEVEGKSPNKHNKFYMTVEPVPKEIADAMTSGEIKDGEIKGKNLEMVDKLEKLGMKREKAKSLILISNRCMLFDNTKGIQYLNETIELIKEAFANVVEKGPLSDEPCALLMINLNDVALHEDAVHRGPAQVIPAVRYGMKQAMLRATPTLLEPKQILRVDTPQEYIGGITSELSNRRGEIMNIEQEEYSAIITVKLPVAEMFGFEGALKSATAGKGFQSLMSVSFEKVPNDIKSRIVTQIRERKGLSKEVPQPEA